jgi:hypothetical protein
MIAAVIVVGTALGVYLMRLPSGWGRFPESTTQVYRPERIAALAELVAAGAPVLARGLGPAYADTALNKRGARSCSNDSTASWPSTRGRAN